jgi:isorenieratene synthase
VTHQDQSWTFDSQHGIHALWGGYDNMRAMLERFLKLPLRPSDGEVWINRWGAEVRAVEAGSLIRHTWMPAPFHYLRLLLRPQFWLSITPLDFLSLPGYLLSMLWACGYDPISEQSGLKGLGMNEFFRGWTPNLKATFVGLGHSLLAAPSESIHLSSFIAAMRYYTLLRRDLWHLDYLPSNPHTCLHQPIQGQIEVAGGKVVLGALVKRLTYEDGYWQIQFEETQRGMARTLTAQHVILAVDPQAARQLLLDSPSTAPQAAQLEFPPALRNATVRLWFDCAPQTQAMGGMFTGDFMVDNFFWLHRMQDEFITWHDVTGGSAIEVHLYASDAILAKPDELLIIEATKEVYAAFPELRGHFIHGSLRRNNTTQTEFHIPTERSLWVKTPWPTLHACGDWVGYPHPSFWMERCTVTGIAAANAVLADLQGPQALYPIIPARPPEWLARFLGGVVKAGRRLLGPPILALARALRRRG